MDNETPADETWQKDHGASGGAAGSPSMPRAEALAVSDRRSGALTTASEDRTGVFRQLVADDGDIAGLVAYSIYKQNKLDWLNAFTAAKGRAPKDDELSAYIIGEGTPRRLATYRHLAEATLAGDGPDIGGGGASGAQALAPKRGMRRPAFADKGAMTTGLLATYALIAVLFVFGFYLAAHYTMSSR